MHKYQRAHEQSLTYIRSLRRELQIGVIEHTLIDEEGLKEAGEGLV